MALFSFLLTWAMLSLALTVVAATDPLITATNATEPSNPDALVVAIAQNDAVVIVGPVLPLSTAAATLSVSACHRGILAG